MRSNGVHRRVVVTGLGTITCIGHDVATTWASALAGRSGIGAIRSFDASNFAVRIAGEIDGVAELLPDDVNARHYDRFVHLGVIAAGEAFRDAGIPRDPSDSERFGTYVGSAWCGLTRFEEAKQQIANGKPRAVSAFVVAGSIPNMASGAIAIQHKLRAPSASFSAACATGAMSIGEAYRMIRFGVLDAAVAGGTDAFVSPVGICSFSAMRALSRRNDAPTEASRPFDESRDGLVVADGAGALVLESLERALARDAHIYCELVGYGCTTDAYHVSAPDPSGAGAKNCMRAAIGEAGLTPADVGHVNAHATSTPAGDTAELKSISDVFRGSSVAVTSTKSMTGHTMGAAGAIEAIFAIKALESQVAPPTINLDRAEGAEGVRFIANRAAEISTRAVMSNNFGFGGINVSLVFLRYGTQG